jgi:hypothetical protein
MVEGPGLVQVLVKVIMNDNVSNKFKYWGNRFINQLLQILQ